MITIEMLREFFGWCLAINIGLMAASTIGLISARGWMTRMHQRMFGMDESALARAYFSYLANYKIAVIVFVMVPYVALRIMA